MRFILLCVAALVLGAIVVAYALLTPPQDTPAPVSKPIVSVPPTAMPSQTSAPHVRRLVATRLGQPRELRFDGVRTVGTRRFGAITCGRVAWGEVAGGATAFKRFVATRRNVILEGSKNFAEAWALSCNE